MAQPIAAAIPFALDQNGRVAIEQAPLSQLRARVTALASTQPGTRVMAVGFGVDTARLLFGFRDPMSQDEIRNDLARAMTFYEPGATLTSVTPIADATGTGVAGVLAEAIRKDQASAVRVGSGFTTVSVGADGSVTDFASTTAP